VAAVKIALVTTTINVPHVLRLYRALDASVDMFIAVDRNTPDLTSFCNELHNSPQIVVGDEWQCSDVLGWNTIQRRNVATLEALKSGADLIVSIDDDNSPIAWGHFQRFENLFKSRFHGLAAAPIISKWWSGYHQFPHRGFPYDEVIDVAFAPVTGLRVGVAEGLCLGDPDIDAYTRMSKKPEAWGVGEVSRNGYVVLPTEPWTTFNSQNTAFVRELAPAMFMLPGVGRYDDIFASMICQRVMRDRGYVTHFGPPFVWQQRNQHNLINDLKAEIFGMEHIVEFAEWLDGLNLGQAPVLNQVKLIFGKMYDIKWMPTQAREAGLAWCEDIAKVM
jgi:hypothetical protein